ncbi:MAG TPA: hypothetical protein VIB60_02620 [Methylomirabilota bacterium]
MCGSNELLVTVLMRERERATERHARLSALLRGASPERERRHSLRERLGFSLIQVGRALLRHGPAYAVVARRRAA